VLLTLALHCEKISVFEVHLKHTVLVGVHLAQPLAKRKPEFARSSERERDDGDVLLTISEELLIVGVPAARVLPALVEVAIHARRVPVSREIRKERPEHDFCQFIDEIDMCRLQTRVAINITAGALGLAQTRDPARFPRHESPLRLQLIPWHFIQQLVESEVACVFWESILPVEDV
jgi:hypothetical protein